MQIVADTVSGEIPFSGHFAVVYDGVLFGLHVTVRHRTELSTFTLLYASSL